MKQLKLLVLTVLAFGFVSSSALADDLDTPTGELLGTNYYEFVCGDHWFIAEGHMDLTYGEVVAHFDGDGIASPFMRTGTIEEQAAESISCDWSEANGGMRFERSTSSRMWRASIRSGGMWTNIGMCLIRETMRR